jgi:hypothetical protein
VRGVEQTRYDRSGTTGIVQSTQVRRVNPTWTYTGSAHSFHGPCLSKTGVRWNDLAMLERPLRRRARLAPRPIRSVAPATTSAPESIGGGA